MSTPFDHWWKLYPGKRKYNKSKCQEKFEKLDVETQRSIYRHTAKCIKTLPDWRDPQFVCAPEVYLNQQRWESEPPSENELAGGRPVSITFTENPAQQLHGLEQLQKHAKDPKLQAQIDELKQHMGAMIQDGNRI
jgi:hypothetical protein